MISENVNSQSLHTERLFCDCFGALSEQSPKDNADSVFLSVICMLYVGVALLSSHFSLPPSLQ